MARAYWHVRVRDPRRFQPGSFRTIAFTPTILAVVGRPKGRYTMEVQALRFAKRAFTREEAKRWAARHGFRVRGIE